MSVQTERLRAQHREVLLQVKKLPFNDKRQALLVSCDELARKIRAIERANEK
jgi:hypothetical protein